MLTELIPLEICEDIKEECEKYGQVLEMKVPRPSGGSRQSNGVGKIFVKYDHADSARTALQALAGRKFADRTVVTTYFSEVSAFYSVFFSLLFSFYLGFNRVFQLVVWRTWIRYAKLLCVLQESFEVNAW